MEPWRNSGGSNPALPKGWDQCTRSVMGNSGFVPAEGKGTLATGPHVHALKSEKWCFCGPDPV